MSQGKAKALMPLDDAWARLRTTVTDHVRDALPGRVETMPSHLVLGRVLAQDVAATVAVPPLDNSAMDGYAVRFADLDTRDDGVPRNALPMHQRIAAGQMALPLAAGSCARIFTGAPIPAGADTVLMQEHAQLDDAGLLRFTQPVRQGQHVRLAGEDIACGQTVLRQSTRLLPAHLGVAASVGRDTLPVYTRPRVALFTTGNELVMPGQALPSGSIYNSNRHTLLGLLQASGADTHDLGNVPDELQTTALALQTAAQHHDLIITSGGVSVGEEDHVRQAVQSQGELEFWALAIKPGKPFVFGRIRRADGSQCLYMGLPGNPVASFVTYLLLVAPVLNVLAGQHWATPRAIPATAAFDWPQPDARREFLRAKMNTDGAIELFGHQGSGVLTSAAWAEGLVDVAPAQTIERGQTIWYLPWVASW